MWGGAGARHSGAVRRAPHSTGCNHPGSGLTALSLPRAFKVSPILTVERAFGVRLPASLTDDMDSQPALGRRSADRNNRSGLALAVCLFAVGLPSWAGQRRPGLETPSSLQPITAGSAAAHIRVRGTGLIYGEPAWGHRVVELKPVIRRHGPSAARRVARSPRYEPQLSRRRSHPAEWRHSR